MSWGAALLVALCLALSIHRIAGQQQACSGARSKRAREFVGGALEQNTALTLTPPQNQAVLPPSYCEYWTVRPDQIQDTSCYPSSPSAGLSYLLVELWLGASWNTTGTSPNWDSVSLNVYRLSNMDDATWAARKKAGYGYTRYLDKTNGVAYHRIIVSTWQAPGAATRSNTTIDNQFNLDSWYLSIDNQDGARSSSGYTLKVSCVNPGVLPIPCPSSDPVGNECNSRGTCETNTTAGAPTNHCKCSGDFTGYACQTSTVSPVDTSATDAAQRAALAGLASFQIDNTVPTQEARKKKKSNFDARWLLILLIIPIAIVAYIVWRAVASKKNSPKVADEEDAKPPPPEIIKEDLESIRIHPMSVPAVADDTKVEDAPKPATAKWTPAPPVVKKKAPPAPQFPYPAIKQASADKDKDVQKDKDTNSSVTEEPVPVDKARERFYAERNEKEKRRNDSKDDGKRSTSRGRKEEAAAARRTHTLRSVDLEEYNRMMRSGGPEEEGLYYRKDKHGRDILSSFDREDFRESSRRRGHRSSRSKDVLSTYEEYDEYETNRSSRRGDEQYHKRSGSTGRRHGSTEKYRTASAGRRRPELDTLESDVTMSDKHRRMPSLSDTEADSFLDYTPSMVEGRRTPPSNRGKQESERDAPLFRERGQDRGQERGQDRGQEGGQERGQERGQDVTPEKGRNTFTKKGKNLDDGGKGRFSSPANVRRSRGIESEAEAEGPRSTRKTPDKDDYNNVRGKDLRGSVEKREKSRPRSSSRGKSLEDIDDSLLLETGTTINTTDTRLTEDARYPSRRGQRHEDDTGAMLQAALRREKEKELRRLEKEKGKEKVRVQEDFALEEVKSDQVSRVSTTSKYSKDSDKLMSKSLRKAAKKAQQQLAVGGDVPSSSSGPSFQKTNHKVRKAQEKIPELLTEETETDMTEVTTERSGASPEPFVEEGEGRIVEEGEESVVERKVSPVKKEGKDGRVKRVQRVVEEEEVDMEVEAKQVVVAKGEKVVEVKEKVVTMLVEDEELVEAEGKVKKVVAAGRAEAAEKVQAVEQVEAAKQVVDPAEAAAKKASEERRLRFAAILDQLPDINANSFQRPGGLRSGTPTTPTTTTPFTPEPIVVIDPNPISSIVTIPVSKPVPAVTNTPIASPAPVFNTTSVVSPKSSGKDTPGKERKSMFGSVFGFGSRGMSSKEGGVKLAPVQTASSAINISEVEPSTPVAAPAVAAAAPLSPVSPVSPGSVDLKDGWRMIQQRYAK